MPTKQYYWYDTEDGEDILKKLDFATKLGLIGSFPLVVFDQVLNQQKTIRGYGFRYLAFTVPAVGMAGMFTLTTQMLCKNVPQVDPKIHYMIGGMAAGSVLGAAKRSMYLGSVTGMYLAVAAFIARSLHETGPASLSGVIKGTLLNDDDFLATDWRNAGPRTLPPPAARPARGGSELFGN